MKTRANYQNFSALYKYLVAILLLTVAFVTPSLYADALGDPVCDTFSNVLQTRKNPSQIKGITDGVRGELHDTPSCRLNTGDVWGDEYNHGLFCDNGEQASATGRYANSLQIDYSFSVDTANADASPASGSANDELIDHNDETLSDEEYDKISQDYNHYDFSLNAHTFTYGSTDKNINTFDSIIGDVTIKYIDSKTVKIGSFSTDSYDDTTLNFDGTPDVVEINRLENSGSNRFQTSITAHDNIEINDLILSSSANSYVSLEAPKVVINSLQSTNNDNMIVIKADEVDIGDITLAQNNDLFIQPFTPGGKVTFHSNSIATSSSAHIILDGGDYYTNNLTVPGTGTGERTIIASDEDQVINFYVNNDLTLQNNPGINSAGNNGNFGSNPATNFRLFVNGDLTTGGGGTTFNAIVYVEGKTDLGSPTYLKGSLSSYDDITIGNDSEFTYDGDLTAQGWGSCTPPDNDEIYSCDIFGSPLISYQSITAGQNEVYNACTISVKDYNFDEDTNGIQVTCYEDAGNTPCHCEGDHCSQNGTCTIIPEPKNRYEHNVYETTVDDTQTVSSDITFSGLYYGNYLFDTSGSGNSSQTITFAPSYTYANDDTKHLMIFGDVRFAGNGQTAVFEEGDYYFRSFKIDKDTNGNINQINVCAKGNIRIFVENDFVYSGNHLNDTECGGKIFVYVRGDADLDANGGGSTDVPVFLYTEGNTLIEPSGNSNAWVGAITAEGDINITRGNSTSNFNFIYDGSADAFGLGECPMCYALRDDGGFFGIENFAGATIRFPATAAIINTSDRTLNDVNASQLETSASFVSVTTPGYYRIVDENGDKVGGLPIQSQTHYTMEPTVGPTVSATITWTGNDSEVARWNPSINIDTPFGEMNADINTTSDFGDYGPGGLDDYYAFETYEAGGHFMGDPNLLEYFADFYDMGRHYSIQLDYCDINDTHVTSVVYQTGPFDAWDDFRGDINGDNLLEDKNVSTKTVSNSFTVVIGSLNAAGNALEGKPGIDARYMLYYLDASNNDVSYDDNGGNGYVFPADTNSTTHTFTVSQALKKAYIRIQYCATKESNGSMTLLCYNSCDPTQPATWEGDSSTGTKLWFHRSDLFAVRPKQFNTDLGGTSYIAEQSNTLAFIAGANIDTNTTGYNETQNGTFVVDINLSDSSLNCNHTTTTLSPVVSFRDGNATASYKFNEIGDYNVTIKEKDDCLSRFAAVDCDDANISGIWDIDNNLTITKAVAQVHIIPYQFLVDANYTNFNNGSFTYLSNLDVNKSMVAPIDIHIQAVKKDGNLSENYTYGCFAKDINVSLSFSGAPSSLTMQSYDDINNTVQTGAIHEVSASLFTKTGKGDANLTVFINFDRNSSTTVNPFIHNLLQVVITDTAYLSGADSSPDSNTTFYYGRLHAPSYTSYNSSVTTPIYAEVYANLTSSARSSVGMGGWQESQDDINWWINPNHTNTYGAITNLRAEIGFSGNADTAVSTAPGSGNFSSGVKNDPTITYNGTALPHPVKIFIDTSAWLKYHRFITDPSKMLYYDVTFVGNGSWHGVGNVGKNLSESNATKGGGVYERLMW